MIALLRTLTRALALGLFLGLLSAPSAPGDEPAAQSTEKNSEARFLLETVGRTYRIERDRWRNRGKPKPPKNPYDENNPNHVPYPYTKNKVIDLDGKTLGLCMALATRPPFAYDKSKMKCRSVTLGTGKEPKVHATFFGYLYAQKYRDCDFVTGAEEELLFWILEQPDNSIDPLTIYRKSLEINGGNIWNAMLSIYQVTRNNARWLIGDRYDYDSTPAKQATFFNKFIDVRGDLEQRGPGFYGDHFGTWYRIWGAMLYRMHFLDEKTFKDGLAYSQACTLSLDKLEGVPGLLSRKFSSLIDDWHSSAVFLGDESLKIYVEQDETDRGKYKVDRESGYAASWLVKGLWKPAELEKSHLTLEKCLSERPYLKTRK